MSSKFRKHPLVCLFVALINLLRGKLRLSDLFIGEVIEMREEANYHIFRHITKAKIALGSKHTLFIVKFKFKQLSYEANKIASLIPMMLISGFPGFIKKVYAVNHKNGYWQGMYQWESSEFLDEYKKSIVFKLMNKRAIPETVKTFQYENKSLNNFIRENVAHI